MISIEAVKEFSVKAYNEGTQPTRKYTGDPYWHHPEEVAELVRSVGGDIHMIAASWLHDTVEDAGVTLQTIETLFGPDVASLVEQLTDVSKPSDGNRAMRKNLDLMHIAQAEPRAKTIKLADLISNMKCIVTHDRKFALVYLNEKTKVLEVLSGGDPILFTRATQILREAKLELGII
jgi:(p)ppGpp synthase/HD superfamily hydrolase